MFSELARALREEHRRAERELSPLERLELARRLGDEAVAAFACAHGLSTSAAAEELSRRKCLGRRRSLAAGRPVRG